MAGDVERILRADGTIDLGVQRNVVLEARA